MDIFTRVNAVYSTFFGTSPPARACIAVDLPDPVNVRLDCLAFSERVPGDRYALHVQGLSYWAPANIGPYSQAIMVCQVGLLFLPIVSRCARLTKKCSSRVKLGSSQALSVFHHLHHWGMRLRWRVNMSNAFANPLARLRVAGKPIHS